MAHQTPPPEELPDRFIEIKPGYWVDALAITAIGLQHNSVMVLTNSYQFGDAMILSTDELRKQVNDIKRAYAKVGGYLNG